MSQIQQSEYEVASECRVIAELSYVRDSISINFRNLIFYPDSNNLYRYLITIKHEDTQLCHNDFTDIDKFLALLAVYLGCRFFKLSVYNTCIRTKYLYPFTYYKCNSQIHPTIFDNDNKIFQRFRNFDNGLSDFLDKVDNYGKKKRQKFIGACEQYLVALQHVGFNIYHYTYDGNGDYGRITVYLMLISAIEQLLNTERQTPDLLREDCFSQIRALLQKAFSTETVGIFKEFEDIKAKYEKDISDQSINRYFKKSIMDHADGYEYIKKGQWEEAIGSPLYVYQDTLETVLGAIYTARSGHIHHGRFMTLSIITYNLNMDWHFSANVDPSIFPKNTKNSHKANYRKQKKLPYEWWFEGLVRHCLLKFCA